MAVRLQVNTKEVSPETYPDGLARSIHFALLYEDGSRTELNRGYGMLFARGEVSKRGTIVPKALKDPEIIRCADGSFLIRAIRTEEDGTEEPEKRMLYWTSEDLIRFRETTPDLYGTYAADISCGTDRESRDNDGVMNEVCMEPVQSSVELTCYEAARVLNFWNADTGKALTHFPQASGLADPVFFRHDEKWYFIFTNDNKNDIGIYVREADSIPELLSDETSMHLILAPDEKRGLIQTFWAPEIHVINGDIWIFFAVSAEEFGPCCHMMKLKTGGSLTDPLSYEEPVPVRRKDGSVLTIPEYRLKEMNSKAEFPASDGVYMIEPHTGDTEIQAADNDGPEREKLIVDLPVTAAEGPVDDRIGISLDMTYLEDAGRSYVLWSYRKGIAGSKGLNGPEDSGSMILIAEITKEKPWQLISDPVLISRPLYGYENARGTINNEGPYVYKRDGMIHVNYSGGDARGYLYIVNLLSAREGSDLLAPASWTKRNTPLCNFTTYPGVYGPGHNSYFTDENGKEWIAFHAVDAMDGKKVSVGIFEYPVRLV